MATITLLMPKKFETIKERFPDIDWNEVIKRGVIKKLEELKKFEELKDKGEL